MSRPASACPLCDAPGGLLLWRGARMRLIRVLDTPDHPAFYRVVWNDHVAEFGDLDPQQRAACTDAMVLVETALRRQGADKINLAALGNMVPHLHWHVIGRWRWDPHWPQPVWGERQRDADATQREALASALPAIDAELAAALARRFGGEVFQITRE